MKENISFEDISLTAPYKGEYLKEISKSIVNDSIKISRNFDTFNKKLDSLNWSEDPFKNDTWQLYYQNLLIVSYLNHSFVKTSQIQYHVKAKSYLKSFIKHHKTMDISTSKFSRYDHSCAFRTLHLFQSIANELKTDKPDIDLIQICFDHLSQNIEFMTDEENYSVHNHSLMMDRSLLYASKAFRSNPSISDELKEISSKRALGIFDKIIDETGLAKEHSTTYHIFNHNLYKSIFNLIGTEETPPDKLLKYLKMNDILLQFIKPDLTFPLWGDSQVEKLSANLITKFENDIRLKSLLNNYDLKSTFNFENNIGSLRTNTSDKSHLILFANYNSRVHKHHDDLSFIFQAFKTDIFTDQVFMAMNKNTDQCLPLL